MTLWSTLLERAPVHATLIDPATTATASIPSLSHALDEAGTDVFLVGGSTGVTGQLVQQAVTAIREASARPVVLFPSSHEQVAADLDAVLYTITFNSRRQDLIIEEPARGAGLLTAAGIEAITTAYVLVEPGMTVGKIAEAELVARDGDGIQRAARYAALARVLRMDAIYLEAGSGAPSPIAPEMVHAAAASGTPVIVGGGIRSAEQAARIVAAGATMVVTGTLHEDSGEDGAAALIGAVHDQG